MNLEMGGQQRCKLAIVAIFGGFMLVRAEYRYDPH